MTTELRDRRLQRAVRASAWWLALQAVLLLANGDALAGWLGLRWMPVMAPYVRLAGLSLLALALFVHRGVDQPRRQYLAVDTLLLLFLGQAFFTLSDQVGGRLVTGYEWFCAGVGALLATALLGLRTTSKRMQHGGALLRTEAHVLARQTALWIAGKGPQPEPALGGLEPQEASAPAPLRWADGSMPLMPSGQNAAIPPPPGLRAEVAGSLAPPPPAFNAAALQALPLPPEEERQRPEPLVPPAPSVSGPAPLPPPSPALGPRSQAQPRLD